MGGRFKMVLEWKRMELMWDDFDCNIGCSCRQLPAEIHRFSGHLRSAKPKIVDLELESTSFLGFVLD